MGRENQFAAWARFAAIVAGGLSALLGVIVLIGWHTHSTVLLQVHPAFTPMQYRTALGFVLCGMGLFLIMLGKPRLATATGVAAGSVGLLGVLECVLGVAAPNQFLLRHAGSLATYNSPLAPNTALCFFLSGVALVLLSNCVKPKYKGPLVSALLSSVIIALGTVAFFGYLGGVETAYGWGRLTAMAVHTAGGFAVLGMGILAYAWCEAAIREGRSPRWLAIPVGTCVVTITLTLWQSLNAHERTQIVRSLKGQLNSLKEEIRETVEPRIFALDRMVKRWEMPPIPSEQGREIDAALHVTDYEAIAWLSPSVEILGMVTSKEPQAARSLSLGVAEWSRALRATQPPHKPTAVHSIKMPQGEKSLLVCVPLEKSGQFLLGVIGFQQLLDSKLRKRLAGHYSLAIHDGEDEVYGHYENQRQHEQEWAQEGQVRLRNLVLRGRIWPTPRLLAQAQSSLPSMALSVGLLMAFLLTLTVHSTQKERWANHGLEKQIAERGHAQTDLHAALNILERQSQQLSALNETSVWINSAQSIEEMIEVITEQARLIIDTGQCATHFAADGDWTQQLSHVSLSEEYSQYLPYDQQPDGTGIYAFVCERNKCMRLTQEELVKHPGWKHFGNEAERHPPLRGWLAAPIIASDGKNQGVIQLSDRHEEDFTEEDEKLLVQLAQLASAAIEIQRAKDELEKRVEERTAEVRRTNRSLQHEVAERKRAEEETAQRSKELQTLLHVTSHDLREPLRAMQNFSVMVCEQYATSLDEKGQDFLHRIATAATRMRSLLDDILMLSRARRIQQPTEDVQGNAIVQEALARLESRISETGASVRVEEDLPSLWADRTWATQAVYNLLANALKYTSAGEVPDLEVAAYRPDSGTSGHVGIVVKDRGPGVAREHSERIFQLFQRAVGREVEGTGAGLAIVRGVAERHSGHAWVQPRDGGGSEFVITFATEAKNESPPAEPVVSGSLLKGGEES